GGPGRADRRRCNAARRGGQGRRVETAKAREHPRPGSARDDPDLSEAVMRIAVTADLHWGHGRVGDAATELLRDHLRREPVDLLLLGGDIGTADHFAECLALFADLPCVKAVVPGNHDLWVADDDARGDSLTVYQEYLPGVCAAHGFHYLDHAPLS